MTLFIWSIIFIFFNWNCPPYPGEESRQIGWWGFKIWGGKMISPQGPSRSSCWRKVMLLYRKLLLHLYLPQCRHLLNLKFPGIIEEKKLDEEDDNYLEGKNRTVRLSVNADSDSEWKKTPKQTYVYTLLGNFLFYVGSLYQFRLNMHETMFERRTFPGGSFLKVFMTACYPGLAFSALVRSWNFQFITKWLSQKCSLFYALWET